MQIPHQLYLALALLAIGVLAYALVSWQILQRRLEAHYAMAKLRLSRLSRTSPTRCGGGRPMCRARLLQM